MGLVPLAHIPGKAKQLEEDQMASGPCQGVPGFAHSPISQFQLTGGAGTQNWHLDPVPTSFFFSSFSNISACSICLSPGGTSHAHQSCGKAQPGVLVLQESRAFPGSVFSHEGWNFDLVP